MKTKQNDNPNMHCSNCNAKNMRKVLLKYFDSNHTIMLSCDNKKIAKIGLPRCPLYLCLKIKVGWVVQEVDFVAADHDTVIKSNLVPAVIFDTDVPNNPNLGNFHNGDAHVGVEDSAILPISAVRQAIEFG